MPAAHRRRGPHGGKRLAVVDGWLAEQRAIWEGRTDRFEQFVTPPGRRR